MSQKVVDTVENIFFLLLKNIYPFPYHRATAHVLLEPYYPQSYATLEPDEKILLYQKMTKLIA